MACVVVAGAFLSCMVQPSSHHSVGASPVATRVHRVDSKCSSTPIASLCTQRPSGLKAGRLSSMMWASWHLHSAYGHWITCIRGKRIRCTLHAFCRPPGTVVEGVADVKGWCGLCITHTTMEPGSAATCSPRAIRAMAACIVSGCCAMEGKGKCKASVHRGEFR